MSIPNFKTNHDWEAFASIFDSRWHCKKALLNRIKDDLYPGYSWENLQPRTLEVINDIVQAMLYDTESDFLINHPEYKRYDDDIFIPQHKFKEEVTEALLEANQKFWNSPQKPFDLPDTDQ